MKQLFCSCLVFLLMYGCLPRKFNEKAGVEGAQASDIVTWENPSLESTAFLKDKNKPDLDKLGEGLWLVDENEEPTTKFDRNKPTVIYSHGATPTGDIPHGVFKYSGSTWAKKYNTFFFRWHRQSYGSIAARPFVTVDYDAYKLFDSEFNRLRSKAFGPSYDKELRIVTYSMGTFLGMRLVSENPYFNVLRKNRTRLDLLESFLVNKDNGRTYRDFIVDLDPRLIDKNLRYLQNATSAAIVTAYGSGVGAVLGAHLWKTVPHVQMNGKWLGEDASRDLQHISIVPMYFQSFDQPPPKLVVKNGTRKAPSAAMTIAEMREEYGKHSPNYFIHTGGIGTVDMSDDTFERKKISDPSTVGLTVDDFTVRSTTGNVLFEASVLQILKISF